MAATYTTGYHASTYPLRSDGTQVDALTLNTPAASLASTSAPPQNGFPVSIAGRTYAVDTSFEPYRREAFRHKSLQPQRQSLHFTNIADDGTVSTEGLWRREARNWNVGAGQIYFDRKGSDDGRYYRSKGINPWTQWNVTLLPDVINQYSSSNTNAYIKAIRAGKYVYFTDNNTVRFCSAWGSYTTVTGISGTVLDLNGDGWQVWILTTSGLYVTTAGNADGVATLTTWSLTALTGSSLTGNVLFTGGRLIVTISGAQSYTNGSSVVIPSGASVFDFSNASGLATAVGYLSAGINSTATTIPVDALTSALTNNQIIQVEGEQIKVSAASVGATSINVNARGQNGTTATSHAIGTPIYALATTAANKAALGWIYTHPNPYWTWTCLAGGSTQIYFGGYADRGGAPEQGNIYRTTIPSTQSPGTIGNLTSPVVALPLPAGEYPTAMRGYLNYIFIGTNKGIRMTQTLNGLDPSGASGDLKSGPLIPDVTQIPSQPVTAIVGNDRYIYWAWNNYDSGSTGLGRLDLTTFIDNLAPAYASDLMISGQGNISWMTWDPITNSPCISITPTAGANATKPSIYTGDPNNCVTSGTIDSGLITYGIPDNKNAIALDFNIANIGTTANSSSVDFTVNTDNGATLDLGRYYGSNQKASVSFPTQQFGEQYRVTTTMYAGKSGGTNNYRVSPTLNRWVLKALPGIPSGVMISAVLNLYEPMEVDGTIRYYDPYQEYAYLEAIRQSQQVVQYVEGPYTANVTIDMIDWLPERLRVPTLGGYHGDMVVYLKTLAG